MTNLGEPLRGRVDPHLQRDRAERCAGVAQAAAGYRHALQVGGRRRSDSGAVAPASSGTEGRSVEGQAEAGRVAALPGQPPLRADMDDFGMDAGVADGDGVDDQVEAGRRTAAQGMTDDRQLDRRFGRMRPAGRPIGELGDGAAVPAVRRMAILQKAFGFGDHDVDRADVAGLQHLDRVLRGRKHRAGGGDLGDAGIDRRKGRFELRGAQR